jgi:hypothetical protein
MSHHRLGVQRRLQEASSGGELRRNGLLRLQQPDAAHVRFTAGREESQTLPQRWADGESATAEHSLHRAP